MTSSEELNRQVAYNKLIERLNTEQQEVNAGLRTHIELSREDIALLNTRNEAEARNLQQLEARLGVQRQLVDASKQDAQTAQDHHNILNLNATLKQQEVQLAQQALADQRAKVAAAERGVATARSAGAQAQRIAAEAYQAEVKKHVVMQKGTVALKNQQQAHSAIYSSTNSIHKTTMGITDAWKQTSFGAIASAGTGAFGTLATTLKSTLSPLNMLGSSLMKIQESTMALIQSGDKLGASFAKQTGLMGTNTAALQRNYYAMTTIAASMGDVNAAHAALATQSSKFIDLGTREANVLIQLSTAMDKAGYGSQFVASQLDTLTIGLGMSVSSVVRFTRTMDAMRQQVGMSIEQFKTDFPAALKTAMFYTGQMEQELQALISVAKSTGVAVSQLQGVVARYDTFEGAGEAVGRLNAILGGPYLNAIQMVYATESQRLNLLRESVSASGRQFSTLEKYEQKAIMAAAGINDINTALQLFGQGANAYNAHIQKQQQLEELARQATPVFEQLKETGMRLAIAFKPFVTVMSQLAKVLEAIAPKTATAATIMSGALIAAFSGMAMQARAAAAAIISSSQTIISALGAEAAAANNAAAALGTRAAAARGAGSMVGRGGLAAVGGMGLVQSVQGGSALGGGVSGALIGAQFGSMVSPGIGTAIGAGIGAIGGGIAGYMGGMASGGRTRGSGTYMVGERGPEMVSLPQGSNVVSNENIGRMMASSARSSQQMSQMTSALKSSLDNLSSKLNTVITIDERKASRDRGNVVRLELDRRVLGETMVDYLNEESQLSLTS